jgi:hypothetical protein
MIPSTVDVWFQTNRQCGYNAVSIFYTYLIEKTDSTEDFYALSILEKYKIAVTTLFKF